MDRCQRSREAWTGASVRGRRGPVPAFGEGVDRCQRSVKAWTGASVRGRRGPVPAFGEGVDRCQRSGKAWTGSSVRRRRGPVPALGEGVDRCQRSGKAQIPFVFCFPGAPLLSEWTRPWILKLDWTSIFFSNSSLVYEINIGEFDEYCVMQTYYVIIVLQTTRLNSNLYICHNCTDVTNSLRVLYR